MSDVTHFSSRVAPIRNFRNRAEAHSLLLYAPRRARRSLSSDNKTLEKPLSFGNLEGHLRATKGDEGFGGTAWPVAFRFYNSETTGPLKYYYRPATVPASVD